MSKRIVFRHGIAIIAICFFGILAMGSTATTQKASSADQEAVVSSETVPSGVVHTMPEPGQKPFTSLGMIFATSTTKYDEKGYVISGQEGIAILLLREAHKLGADDILNLRIDENVTWISTTSETSTASSSNGAKTSKTTVIMTKNVTYTGSALAIKYLDR